MAADRRRYLQGRDVVVVVQVGRQVVQDEGVAQLRRVPLASAGMRGTRTTEHARRISSTSCSSSVFVAIPTVDRDMDIIVSNVVQVQVVHTQWNHVVP